MGTDLQRRLFTADEYHRMGEAGVLEIFTAPSARGYQQSRRAGRGEPLVSIAFPAATLLASHVFGDAHA